MSGVWIKLHDTRVRVDRSETPFWEVAACLDNLFNVPALFLELEIEEGEELC